MKVTQEIKESMMHLFKAGYTYEEIAEALDVSKETVQYHIVPMHKNRKLAYNKKRYMEERALLRKIKAELQARDRNISDRMVQSFDPHLFRDASST